jgi:hypothetical protein
MWGLGTVAWSYGTPEPSTTALFLGGLSVIYFVKRKTA